MNNVTKERLLKIIGIILLILILIFTIYKIITYKEKPFNHIIIDEKFKIVNATNLNYLDTIMYAGLKTLYFNNNDTIYVAILPLSKIENYIQKDKDVDLQAFITGRNNMYQLFIGEYSRNKNIEIISHEIIHLEQYYTDKIQVLNNILVVWEKDTVNINEYTDYYSRPWEKEAFNGQKSKEVEMRSVLY